MNIVESGGSQLDPGYRICFEIFNAKRIYMVDFWL